jgi:hypothetical protein
MPKGQLYIDVALSNVAFGYRNGELIADKIFPTIPVSKQSGKVYKFGKDAFRLVDDLRQPGAVSNRIQSYSVSTDTYYCANHAVNDVIPDEDAENADVAVNPEVATTEGLTNNIKLRREQVLASYLFNTTTFSGKTAAVGTKWSDYTSSDPVADVDTAIETIRQATGSIANTIVMGKSVFNKLKRHPLLLDMFKYTQKGILTADLIAEALHVDRLLVGGAVYNTGNEGTSDSMSDIWGSYCLVAYIAPKPEMRAPSLGYSYTWMTGVGGYSTYRLYEIKPHATWIEVMNYYSDIATQLDLGYLLSSCI